VTSTDATAAGQGRAGVWNLPNILTMIRIALVPFFCLVPHRGRAGAAQ